MPNSIRATTNMKDSKLKEILRRISEVKSARKTVKVGVLTGGDEKVGNATVAFYGLVNEYGSIVNNTPERSFIRKPLYNHLKEKVEEKGKIIAKAFLDNGNSDRPYSLLGIIGVNIIQGSFTSQGDGTWAANAPITKQGGIMRNKVSGKLFMVKGKGKKRPLSNSGRLRRSISYEVSR